MTETTSDCYSCNEHPCFVAYFDQSQLTVAIQLTLHTTVHRCALLPRPQVVSSNCGTDSSKACDDDVIITSRMTTDAMRHAATPKATDSRSVGNKATKRQPLTCVSTLFNWQNAVRRSNLTSDIRRTIELLDRRLRRLAVGFAPSFAVVLGTSVTSSPSGRSASRPDVRCFSVYLLTETAHDDLQRSLEIEAILTAGIQIARLIPDNARNKMTVRGWKRTSTGKRLASKQRVALHQRISCETSWAVLNGTSSTWHRWWIRDVKSLAASLISSTAFTLKSSMAVQSHFRRLICQLNNLTQSQCY